MTTLNLTKPNVGAGLAPARGVGSGLGTEASCLTGKGDREGRPYIAPGVRP